MPFKILRTNLMLLLRRVDHMKNYQKTVLRELTRSRRNHEKVSIENGKRSGWVPAKRFFYSEKDLQAMRLDLMIIQSSRRRDGINHVEITSGFCSCGAEGCSFVRTIHEKADACLIKVQKKNAVFSNRNRYKKKTPILNCHFGRNVI